MIGDLLVGEVERAWIVRGRLRASLRILGSTTAEAVKGRSIEELAAEIVKEAEAYGLSASFFRPDAVWVLEDWLKKQAKKQAGSEARRRKAPAPPLAKAADPPPKAGRTPSADLPAEGHPWRKGYGCPRSIGDPPRFGVDEPLRLEARAEAGVPVRCIGRARAAEVLKHRSPGSPLERELLALFDRSGQQAAAFIAGRLYGQELVRLS